MSTRAVQGDIRQTRLFSSAKYAAVYRRFSRNVYRKSTELNPARPNCLMSAHIPFMQRTIISNILLRIRMDIAG
jgi:hypothetical protein